MYECMDGLDRHRKPLQQTQRWDLPFLTLDWMALAQRPMATGEAYLKTLNGL